jgi:hypothetical protein
LRICIRSLPNRFLCLRCAFVNFKDRTSAERTAEAQANGLHMDGEHLGEVAWLPRAVLYVPLCHPPALADARATSAGSNSLPLNPESPTGLHLGSMGSSPPPPLPSRGRLMSVLRVRQHRLMTTSTRCHQVTCRHRARGRTRTHILCRSRSHNHPQCPESPLSSPPFYNHRSYHSLSASTMSTSTASISIAPTITPHAKRTYSVFASYLDAGLREEEKRCV